MLIFIHITILGSILQQKTLTIFLKELFLQEKSERVNERHIIKVLGIPFVSSFAGRHCRFCH